MVIPRSCSSGIGVGFRRAFVDGPDAVLGAGVIEHPFGDGRFAGIDVGDDADVSKFFDVAGHRTQFAELSLVDVIAAYNANAASMPGRFDRRECARRQWMLRLGLPGEVGKRLVGLGHAVHIFPLRHRGTFLVVGSHEFVRQGQVLGSALFSRTATRIQRIASDCCRTLLTCIGTW